jgi:hypothetical protein
MRWTAKNGEPIQLNGAFHVSSMIMRFVIAPAAEAKLGALYDSCQTGMIFRLTLNEMRHPQPKTPVHCDNANAVGIANNSIKQQLSCSMEMQIFWVGDKSAQGMYDITWHPGMENLADNQSKHHLRSHHVNVRPWYLHMENSPRYLPRAQSRSTLKGCVGTLKGGYVCNVPLPRAPQIQSTCLTTGREPPNICYSQVPRVPTWGDITRLLAGLGRTYLPFLPVQLM